MNNITVKLGTSFLLFLLWASFSFAQDRYDPRGVVRGQLMNLISVRFGPEFKSVGFSIFDSLIFHSQNESKHIQDPYKTLKGCVLFSTYKDNGDGLPDNFIAGRTVRSFGIMPQAQAQTWAEDFFLRKISITIKRWTY